MKKPYLSAAACQWAGRSILLLLAVLSIALRDPSGLLAGIPCAAGLAAAWLIGRGKAKAAERAQLEKMRARDL